MNNTSNSKMSASRSAAICSSPNFLVALEDNFAGVGIDDVVRGHLADELLLVEGQLGQLGLTHFPDGRAGELLVLANDDLVIDHDLSRGALPREQYQIDALVVLLALDEDRLGLVEVVEQMLGAVAQCAQQHRRVHLAAPIDANKQKVLGVELEVQPRTAVRNDPCGVKHLPLEWVLPCRGRRKRRATDGAG